MIYKEDYVSRAFTVDQLIFILDRYVPKDADVEVDASYGEHTLSVEVWYDKDTNTVILK